MPAARAFLLAHLHAVPRAASARLDVSVRGWCWRHGAFPVQHPCLCCREDEYPRAWDGARRTNTSRPGRNSFFSARHPGPVPGALATLPACLPAMSTYIRRLPSPRAVAGGAPAKLPCSGQRALLPAPPTSVFTRCRFPPMSSGWRGHRRR